MSGCNTAVVPRVIMGHIYSAEDALRQKRPGNKYMCADSGKQWCYTRLPTKAIISFEAINSTGTSEPAWMYIFS